MEIEKTVMLKLYNGDFIIGTADSKCIDDDSCISIVLNDPRAFTMMPTMTGGMSVALHPVCMPFKSARLKKELDVRKDQVMFILNEAEIDSEIINGYKSEISGIRIATAAQAASIANASANAKPKDFII